MFRLARVSDATRHGSGEPGFAIVEAIVSIGIVTTALVTLVQVLATATANNILARNTSSAAMLAQQKIEQLRATEWASLTSSPPDALESDIDGWVDYLDAGGSAVGGSGPPGGTVYVRRWSIVHALTNPDDVCVFEVLVTPLPRWGKRVARQPGEVRMVSIRTRR